MKARAAVLTSTALLLVLCGCQTPPQIADLQARNATLQQQLDSTRAEVQELTDTKERLNKEITYMKYVNRVLEKEKEARTGEAEGLRQTTRAFIRDQMQAVHAFAQREVLLNYVGSELTERAMVKGEDELLVDLDNRIPADGTLVEGRVFLAEPAPFFFTLLREVQDQMIVLWKSDAYAPTNAGLHQVTFAVPVSAQAGDCIGTQSAQCVTRRCQIRYCPTASSRWSIGASSPESSPDLRAALCTASKETTSPVRLPAIDSTAAGSRRRLFGCRD